MASLYERERSPFFWVKFRDPATGKTRRESTEIRTDSKEGKRQARKLLLEIKMRETEPRAQRGEHFEMWVEGFLNRRYRNQPETLKRYLTCWHWIDEYFQEIGIRTPRQLDYTQATNYVTWRTQYKKRGKGTVSTNTALIDLKVLRIIMREAVRSEFCDRNPCEHLGISRDKPEPKPEITDEEIHTIRQALKSRPEWMSRAFEIALNTGCRISETQIALKHVDLQARTIYFPNPKGGPEKAYSIPLPSALLPMFKKMKEAGEEVTLTLPPMSAKTWWQFFKEIGLPHLCFHCTRVTFVTRGCRAGLPEAVVRKLVNHGDELVHRVYQRLNVQDVAAYVDKIPLPAVS